MTQMIIGGVMRFRGEQAYGTIQLQPNFNTESGILDCDTEYLLVIAFLLVTYGLVII